MENKKEFDDFGFELSSENKNMDSWKIDGNCDSCRRQKYCSTQCRINKIREQRMISQLVSNAISKHWEEADD